MLNDMTRCHGHHCSLRMECARHTAPIPDNVMLSWAATLNTDRAHLCAYYISNTKEADYYR